MILKTNLICLFLVLAQIGASAFASESEKPNVLMICIDDLNDWTGFIGGKNCTMDLMDESQQTLIGRSAARRVHDPKIE